MSRKKNKPINMVDIILPSRVKKKKILNYIFIHFTFLSHFNKKHVLYFIVRIITTVWMYIITSLLIVVKILAKLVAGTLSVHVLFWTYSRAAGAAGPDLQYGITSCPGKQHVYVKTKSRSVSLSDETNMTWCYCCCYVKYIVLSSHVLFILKIHSYLYFDPNSQLRCTEYSLICLQVLCGHCCCTVVLPVSSPAAGIATELVLIETYF